MFSLKTYVSSCAASLFRLSNQASVNQQYSSVLVIKYCSLPNVLENVGHHVSDLLTLPYFFFLEPMIKGRALIFPRAHISPKEIEDQLF